MRNDVKKYYQSQFGSFPNMSVKEISELNDYELRLLELPQLFYSKAKRADPELSEKLEILLTTSKN